ncbi:MAG TPA: ATP synthase F0 subunit B [Terriglobales bacterium]|nr:ATP synthase F0 subunit B [Terriglobales bacterium]
MRPSSWKLTQPSILLIAWVIFLSIRSQPAHALSLQEPSSASDASLSPGQELAKESREAAGEEGSAQFKHSAPVRWISRLTGLNLEQSYLLGMGINFAIVAGVVIWISRKYLPAFFRNRTAMIQKAMEEARQASADANRRLAEIENRLSKLDVEIAEMRTAAEKEAAAEEEKIRAAADEDARKIVESVGQEISVAVRTARRELTAYAADLAVALAKKQIHVDASTDQILVHHFASQLSNGGERKDRT